MKKIKIIFLFIIALFFVFWLGGFIFLTNFVKERQASLIKNLSGKLGREITAGKIKVDFLGGVNLFDVEINSLGEDDSLEYFRAKRFTVHLHFLNLVRDRKNYRKAFRKISFQKGKISLKALPRPIVDIKGKIYVTNGELYINAVRFSLGESEFVCRGGVKNYPYKPELSLNVHTDKFEVSDLLCFWPGLGSLKLNGKGKISARITVYPGGLKILGGLALDNVRIQKFQLSKVSSDFYFGNGFINFSSIQIKALKGQLSGKIKISDILSYPSLDGKLIIKALQLPFGECFGELNLAGNLYRPKIFGKLKINKDEFSLTQINCQLKFLPNALYFENGEAAIGKLGTVLWRAELKDNLNYNFYFCLPSLRSKNLSYYIKNWPNFPGIFRIEGEVGGLLGSLKMNSKGKLLWSCFAPPEKAADFNPVGNKVSNENGGRNFLAGFDKVKAINWDIGKEENLIKIKRISLDEEMSLDGFICPRDYSLELQLKLNNFNPAGKPLNGRLKLTGDKKGLILEGSILSSEILECKLKGEKKRNKIKLKAVLQGEKAVNNAELTLSGEMLPAGFSGKVLISPIIIHKKTYLPLSGLIKLNSKKMIFEKFKWLEAYFFNAEISFLPLGFACNLLIDDADIVPILVFFPAFCEEDNYGKVYGKVDCKGIWPDITVKGFLELKDSKIAEKKIEYAKFRFEGTVPYIILKESPLLVDDTALICKGQVDFSRGGSGMFKDVECGLDGKEMVWKGWKIKDEEEKKKLSLTKEVSGGFAVSLNAPTIGEGEGNLALEPGPEVELEYRLKGKEKLKLRIDEDEDFIGIEHEVTF